MSRQARTAHPQHHRPLEPDPTPWRRWLLAGLVVVGVIGAGLVVGFGDFLGRPTDEGEAATPVRMSMAGFDPAIITARAGQDLTLEMWTTDAAPHLQGGVHTLISDELGFYEELQAESSRTVTLRMPAAPGDYDIYCNTCCGGKASPTMHAILRVEG